MSGNNKDNKPNVDLLDHGDLQWSDFINIREADDTRRDIVQARERLGKFSVRFVTEAIYGEEYAQTVFGNNGGKELVRDLVLDRRTLGHLAHNMGGQKTKVVAQRAHLNEDEPAIVKSNAAE